jgi:hypothetical protein
MGSCASKEEQPSVNQPNQPNQPNQQQQQQQQANYNSPSAPPPQRQLADPTQVQVGVMGNGHSSAEGQGGGGEGTRPVYQRTVSNGFSTASAPPSAAGFEGSPSYPPPGGSTGAMMYSPAAPMGMPMSPQMMAPAPAPFGAGQPGVSFSPWNADGANMERNRSIALMLRTIHEALLDEPATSESLRMRAQQALRQSEREVAELHAMPRLHGLHFNPTSSSEVAILSSLDAKSPATTASLGPGGEAKPSGVVGLGSHAQKPDLHKGDRLLAVEGINVLGAQHAAALLHSQLCLPGQSVELTIQRGSGSGLPFRTHLIMASSDASPFDLEQRHARIAANLDFVSSLRAEVEQQKELDARTALDRVREETAVARAAELARQRAREAEESERYSAQEAAYAEAQQSSAYRARKIAERSDRVSEASQELAFRAMMLVLARHASVSSSSLSSGGAASAHAPQGIKESLKNLLVQCLPPSGTVEAALFGEDGLVVAPRNAGVSSPPPSTNTPISSIALPNSKLALAELQQHIVMRLLSAGPSFLSQPLGVQRGALEGVLAEWRQVQQSKAVAEAQHLEATRLAALRTSEARQQELEQVQRQIQATKQAALDAAINARRHSAAERQQQLQQQPGQQQTYSSAYGSPAAAAAPGAPGESGWEGMPPWKPM